MEDIQEEKPEVPFAQQESDIPLNPVVQLFEIFGMLETVTTAPTLPPRGVYQQIKLYTDSISSPSVYRLYIYMPRLNAWKYVALS